MSSPREIKPLSLKVDDSFFAAIKAGTKTVDIRMNYRDVSHINPGTEIMYWHFLEQRGKEEYLRSVAKVELFATLNDLRYATQEGRYQICQILPGSTSWEDIEALGTRLVHNRLLTAGLLALTLTS